MSKTQKNIVYLSVLVVLASFAIVQFWLGPILQTNQTSLNQINADVSAKTDRLKTINDIKEPLAKLESTMSDIDQIGMPKGDSLPDLIEEVENIVNNTKDANSNAYFSIASFNPNLSSSTSAASAAASSALGATVTGLSSIDFSLAIKGNPDNLSYLFDAFNNSLRPMTVNSITIAPDTASTDVLATLSMTAYSGKSTVSPLLKAATTIK